MFEKLKYKFSTPEKRLEEFSEIRKFSLSALIIGSFFGGAMAYHGIENKVITLEDNLIYTVNSSRYPKIITETDGIIYNSICQNGDNDKNHICIDSLNKQKLIGKNVRFLTYYKKYNFLSFYKDYSYEGIILSGTFINQKNNKVYQVIPTEKELNKVKYIYNGQILFFRFLLVGSFIGLIVSMIAIARENTDNK